MRTIFQLLMLFTLSAIAAASSSTAPPAPQCRRSPRTKMDFRDENVSVVASRSRGEDCCAACAAWNAAQKRTAKDNCSVVVWHNSPGTFPGGDCALKATMLQPYSPPLCDYFMPLAPPAPKAPFRFSNIYTSEMVLQASPQRAKVHGLCAPGDSVSVQLDGGAPMAAAIAIMPANAERGAQTVWSVVLPATRSSFEAHEIVVRSKALGAGHTLNISGVLFGDVWVCGGQSNMAYALSGSNGHGIVHPRVNDSAAEIERMKTYSGKLRLFRAAVAPSPTPQLELQLISAKDGGSNASVSSHPAGWSDPCPGGKCRIDFSSLCWFYGRNLYETLEPKRPIGLLASYQGGTADELWSSREALAKCTDPENKTNAAWSGLWNGNIVPLLNTTIKGAIWYQGEADSRHPGGRYDGYNCTFPEMIRDWRRQWFAGTGGLTDETFPFGFVQLNAIADATAYTEPTYPRDHKEWSVYDAAPTGYAALRWSQSAGFGFAPNSLEAKVFQAVIVDTPDTAAGGYNVHSPFKQPVASRLLRAALPIAYPQQAAQPDCVSPRIGKAIVPSGDLKTYSVPIALHGAQKVVIHNATGTPGNNVSGFEVFVSDGTKSQWLNTLLVPAVPVSEAVKPEASVTVRLADERFFEREINKAMKPIAMRYLWWGNPCGYTCFNCAVYVKVKEIASIPTGEKDFLPLPPFYQAL